MVAMGTPVHRGEEGGLVGRILTRVIVEYEQTHPRVSSHEVREAVRMAAQVASPGRGVERQVFAVGAGVAVLLAGVVAYGVRSGAVNLPFEIPTVAFIAFLGVMFPLLALLRRGNL